MAENSTTVGRIPSSPWHSPVPYLFGGLAAMLGLIAFALMILACSYWKLSGHMDGREENERDLENGGEKSGEGSKVQPHVYEEKIVVIMAGDVKPTYLATPMSSRASSFGNTSTSSSSCSSSYEEESEKPEKSEKSKQGQVEVTIEEEQIVNRVTLSTQHEEERGENLSSHQTTQENEEQRVDVETQTQSSQP